MKNRVLVILLALSLWATGAEAAQDVIITGGAAYNRRVAVISDNRWPALQVANYLGSHYALDRTFAGLYDRLREAGCVVDFYDAALFEKSGTSNLYLWQTFGNYYPVTIMVGFSGDGSASRKRWFCADSTTTHMIHLGPGNNGNGVSQNDSAYGIVDSLTTAAYTASGSATVGSRGAFKVYGGNRDTIFVDKVGIGGRYGVLPTGVTSVVRLLEPIALTSGLAFSPTADSSSHTLPAAGDSVAKPKEYLGVAWRVYWTGTACVDFVKGCPSPTYADNISFIPYMLAARYLDIRPLRSAVEMDDLFDENTQGLGAISGVGRATNAAWDSIMTTFQNSWKLKPAASLNPLHAAQYINGTDPTWETAWSGPGWSWYEKWKMPWVHHAHDSSAARITSNLLGRFGGYSTGGTGNGSTDSSGAFGTRYRYTRRYAFRFDPTNADNEKKWGIYQRLVYSDSLRRRNCPTCPLPPYLSFPNNEALTVNAFPRSLTANPNWYAYRSLGDCPIDSMLLAIAKGLNAKSGQTVYLRAYWNTGTGAKTNVAWRPWGDRSILNFSRGAALNDSLVGQSLFSLPDEERWVHDRANNYHVKFKCIGTTSYDATDAAGYRAASSPAIAQMLGFWNPVQYAGGAGSLAQTTDAAQAQGRSTVYEQFTADANGIGQVNARQRHWSGKQHVRMVYFHPLAFQHASGPKSSYSIDVFTRGVLQPVRGLNTLAGKSAIVWVQPWELYER